MCVLSIKIFHVELKSYKRKDLSAARETKQSLKDKNCFSLVSYKVYGVTFHTHF